MASPITIVPKKNNTFRVCVDYTFLNRHTVPLSFPLPLIQDLPDRLTSQHQFFTVLDLREAYHSLPLTQRAQELASIVSHSGGYLPVRCPFGLRNAPAAFSALVAEVISGCEAFCFVYLDDFILFSQTLGEHVTHVRQILQRLHEYGLRVNIEKCHFAQPEVKFLGHRVSKYGLRPLADKVEALSNLQPPSTLKGLRSLLGALNYYRSFIPNIAETLTPLYDLLKGPKRKRSATILWENTHQEAFTKVLEQLKTATHLAFDDMTLPLILTTDASLHTAGAVLEQGSSEVDLVQTKPLAFFSKSLPVRRTPPSTFHRELCALHLAMRHFKYKIGGRRLIVRTDHAALVTAVQNGYGEHSPLERRMLDHISQYNPEMIHIAGVDNTWADFLSRPNEPSPLTSISPHETLLTTKHERTENISTITHETLPTTADEPTALVTVEQIAKQQNEDNTLIAKVTESTEITTKKLTIETKLIEVQDNKKIHVLGVRELTSDSFRPVIPETLRAAVFRSLHNTLHPGADRTLELISTTCWWPLMREDIALWSKTCPNCQKSKVTRHNRGQLTQYPPNGGRFEVTHADLAGPLEPSQGYKYFITLRERTTGFLMTHPLQDKSTWSVIEAIKYRLISVFGVPSVIITDNGGEFSSHAFANFCTSLGIKHKKTTPYHPQANGQAERPHRIIKSALRAQGNPSEWSEHLPFITLTINNLSSDNNFFTPFQHTFGQSGRLPGTFILGNEKTTPNTGVSHMYSFFSHLSDMYRSARRLPTIKSYTEPTLFSCDKVWVRQDAYKTPLAPLYHGPYKVLERDNKYFTILHHRRGPTPVSIDRLKVAFELPPSEAAAHILQEEEEHTPKTNTERGVRQTPYNLRENRTINYRE